MAMDVAVQLQGRKFTECEVARKMARNIAKWLILGAFQDQRSEGIASAATHAAQFQFQCGKALMKTILQLPGGLLSQIKKPGAPRDPFSPGQLNQVDGVPRNGLDNFHGLGIGLLSDLRHDESGKSGRNILAGLFERARGKRSASSRAGYPDIRGAE